MRVRVEKKTLYDAINIVSKAVPSRSPMEILQGIMIEVNGNKMILTATDLNTTIIKEIDVDGKEDGRIVVPAKLFAGVVRSIVDKEIIELEKEKTKVVVKTNKLSFDVLIFNDNEYPNIKKDQNPLRTMKIGCDVVERLIKSTHFAASTDETRGILTGVLTEIKDNTIRLVGVDGFRLAMAEEKLQEDMEDISFVTGAKDLLELSKIAMSKIGSTMKINLTKKMVEFEFNDTLVISRLMEGEFVNYNGIIPKDFKTKIMVSRAELKESVLRATLLAKEGKHNLIVLELIDGRLVVNARSDMGVLREELDATIMGGSLTIGFNARYMLDALNSILDDNQDIKIEFNTELTPFVMSQLEGDDWKHMILPVRISAANF